MKNIPSYQQTIYKEYNIAEVFIKNNVVEVFCKEFITISLNDLKAFINDIKKEFHYQNHLKFITHIQPTTVFEIPARTFYLKTLSLHFKKAEAIVTENISQQFILETLLDKTSVKIPVKVFNTREEAIKWIQTV